MDRLQKDFRYPILEPLEEQRIGVQKPFLIDLGIILDYFQNLIQYNHVTNNKNFLDSFFLFLYDIHNFL